MDQLTELLVEYALTLPRGPAAGGGRTDQVPDSGYRGVRPGAAPWRQHPPPPAPWPQTCSPAPRPR